MEKHLEAFVALGEYIRKCPEPLQAAIRQSTVKNPWFTEENTDFALEAIREKYLDEPALNRYVAEPFDKDPKNALTIGLILAGNIPAVGFHDVLTTILAGHRALIKCSSRDPYLIPFLLERLCEIDEALAEQFEIVDTLKTDDFDAVIATGSNHTARHFERYFEKIPHLIRRNRNGVAVLSGEESDAVLRAYGADVFMHFGLGCRNVSKLYLPEGFEMEQLINAFEPWQHIIHHEKYKHNFDYNLSTYIINGDPHIATDFVVLLPRESIISRIGTLHFEFYSDQGEVESKLEEHRQEVQCISTSLDWKDDRCVRPGETQRPEIDDFADGVNTFEFLQSL